MALKVFVIWIFADHWYSVADYENGAYTTPHRRNNTTKMADAEADTAQIASPVAPGPGILGRLGMTLREVALAGVLLVLFAVVIGLSVGVSKAGGGGGQKSQSGGSGVPPNTCMTPECLELSASLLANVDSSQDPCQDFHKYACGLWAIRHPVPPARREVKFIQKVRRGQKEKVRALLDERIARGDMNSFERKVKEVWLSCMDDFGRMTARANPMLNIINGSLGGWYVMDKNWNQTYNPNWTFQKAFTSAQKDFLVDALFKIEVRPDPKDTTRAMIHVSIRKLFSTIIVLIKYRIQMVEQIFLFLAYFLLIWKKVRCGCKHA